MVILVDEATGSVALTGSADDFGASVAGEKERDVGAVLLFKELLLEALYLLGDADPASQEPLG